MLVELGNDQAQDTVNVNDIHTGEVVRTERQDGRHPLVAV